MRECKWCGGDSEEEEYCSYVCMHAGDGFPYEEGSDTDDDEDEDGNLLLGE